jgi:hypothetical protein
MNLIWNFDLFVVATTDETEKTPTTQNPVDNVYVGQAMTQWNFNASGTFLNEQWSGDPFNPVRPIPVDTTKSAYLEWPAVKWTATSQQPKVSGDSFNSFLWSTFWKPA